MNKIKKIVDNYYFHRNYDTDKILYDEIWEEAQLVLLKEMYNDNRTWQEPLEVIEERMIEIMDKRVNKVVSLDTNKENK